VLTKMFPNIHKMLVERSVASIDTGYIVAPADIKKEIQSPKLPIMRNSYWIPRHTLTALLWDAVDEHNESRDDNSLIGRVDYEQGVNCVSIYPSNELENHISVVVKNKDNGEEKIIDGKLVVGADGIKSKVRECLQEQTGLFGSWHYKKNKFKIRKWVTPATGLKLKVLQLPANRYSIKDSNGKNIMTKNTDIVAVRGIKDGPLDRLTLSSLPVQDSDAIRAGNCIARPNHILWTMTTGAEVKVWFKDNYPRLDLDALISDDEWERFAKAKGLAFPPCQYSPGLQVSSDNNECGVLLIGDAAHAFSPDIGQGINSGFMDVVQFNEILSKTSSNEKSIQSKVSLGAALKEYEHIQAPETRALIRLARFGSPYQYNQSLRKDRLGKKLWTANIALRVILNKITFGVFPKPMIMNMSNIELTYRKVVRKADLGTAGLVSVLAFSILKLAVRRNTM